MADFCEELPGVWGWGTNIPFPEIMSYLSSLENNKSKNLKLTYIASTLHQYNQAYGLSDERKQVVKQLYEAKQPINNQNDLDMGLKHVQVFINDEYLVEEALLQAFGDRYKLRYYNSTHDGLGKPVTKKELREPDFINEDNYTFEAKMCWEASASKFESAANLDYTIDPENFNETDFLTAFNKLPQTNVLHTAQFCFCLVKKRATFGYVVGIELQDNKGISAKLLGPLTVAFFKANQKFI